MYTTKCQSGVYAARCINCPSQTFALEAKNETDYFKLSAAWGYVGRLSSYFFFFCIVPCAVATGYGVRTEIEHELPDDGVPHGIHLLPTVL
jgi:hypothetical protein